MAQQAQSIGNALRAARKTLRVSQHELSKQLGIGQGTLSRAETSTDVRFGTLAQIARALDLELVLVPRRLVPAIDAIVRHGSVSEPADPDRDEPYDEAYDTSGER